jgi:TM2 domain-containing membrane protein YozV
VSPDHLIGLNASAADSAPLMKKKSAGLAWLLSMVVPGAGHFYCGLHVRGGLVLGFSVVGMGIFVSSIASQAAGGSGGGAWMGQAVLFLPVLYVFGFLDAYFSAREINRGIDPTLVDNPRVACVLNFTTKGFGYFYLGERVKGVVVFVAFGLANVIAPALIGGEPMVLTAVAAFAFVVSVVMAIDGYRIGRRSFEAQISGLELAAEAPPSRLPAAVPLIAGGLIIGLLVLVVVAGVVASAIGVGQG